MIVKCKNSLGRLRHDGIVVEGLQQLSDSFINLHLVTRTVSFPIPIHAGRYRSTSFSLKSLYKKVKGTMVRFGDGTRAPCSRASTVIKSSLCSRNIKTRRTQRRRARSLRTVDSRSTFSFLLQSRS